MNTISLCHRLTSRDRTKSRQEPAPPRLNVHDVLNSELEPLNLERGIFRTLLDLLARLRTVVETYLFHDRSKYSKPTTLLKLTLAAGILACRHWLPAANSYSSNLFLTITAANQDEVARLALLREYDDMLRLLLVPATSVLSYFLFRKQAWFFAEHPAFNAYLLAFQFFLMTILLPLTGSQYEWVAGAAILSYIVVTCLRCMNGPRLLTLLKALAVAIGSSRIFLAAFYPIASWVL